MGDVLFYTPFAPIQRDIGTAISTISTFWEVVPSGFLQAALDSGPSGHIQILLSDDTVAISQDGGDIASTSPPGVSAYLNQVNILTSWGPTNGLVAKWDGGSVDTGLFNGTMGNTLLYVGVVSAGGNQLGGTIKDVEFDNVETAP
jgi:hypothetical protein